MPVSALWLCPPSSLDPGASDATESVRHLGRWLLPGGTWLPVFGEPAGRHGAGATRVAHSSENRLQAKTCSTGGAILVREDPWAPTVTHGSGVVEPKMDTDKDPAPRSAGAAPEARGSVTDAAQAGCTLTTSAGSPQVPTPPDASGPQADPIPDGGPALPGTLNAPCSRCSHTARGRSLHGSGSRKSLPRPSEKGKWPGKQGRDARGTPCWVRG